MNDKGILLVVSGFAGSGKGTIMKELISKYDNYALSISATTRKPREGEQEGVHYFFKTKEEFEQMIEKGEFLEYANYVGNYYGTPRAYVEQQLNSGKDVILEIEVQGGLNVRKIYPDAMLVFVLPPNVAEIRNRLKKRGTESDDVILKRMERGSEEAEIIGQYDYLMINDNLDECVRRLHYTVQSARCAVKRNLDFVEDIKNQFAEFLKGE